MTCRSQLSAVLCCAALALDAAARGGDLDTAFGDAGRAQVVDAPIAVASLADGKVVIATRGREPALVRHLADGRPDPAFQGGRVALGTSFPVVPQAIAAGPDGAIFVAGHVADSCTRLGVARFDSAGRLDGSYGAGGIWRSACRLWGMTTVHVAALPDGGIVAYGNPMAFHSHEFGEPVIARLDARGQLDPAYGNGGYARAPFDRLYDPPNLVIAADGSIEMVRYEAVGGRYRLWSSRLRADGSIERSPSGAAELELGPPPVFTESFKTVMLADGTRLVLGAGAARVGVVAYGRDHQPLGTFGEAGRVELVVAAKFPHPRAQHAYRTPDGGMLLVISDVYGVEDYELVKLDARGALDPAFGTGGRLRLSVVPGQEWHVDASMQADGHALLVGGLFTGTGYDTGWLARMQVVGDVVEFHNAILDHYFVALDGDEARGIDAGAAGPGWSRTGGTWRPGGAVPVCRFYGTPGVGPNSHFFTAEAGECEQVKRSHGWSYEGLGFYVTRVTDGGCAAPLRAVHRLYNDGWRTNNSNHRYTTDTALIPAMTARGWFHEGVVFCAKP